MFNLYKGCMMSVSNAKSFIQKVNNDEALAQQLGNTTDVAMLVRKGDDMGLSFSAAELQEAVDELYGELGEADLDVSGGAMNVLVKTFKVEIGLGTKRPNP